VKAIRLAAVVAAISVTATLIGSAGAGTGASGPTVDLSTNQAVTNYLTSLGIDPAGVVIQRGAKNYAGPRCPGIGWTCTTSTRVVQVAQAGGQNQVACGAGANVIPDSYLTSALTQNQINQLVTASTGALPVTSCVVVQGGGAQTNTTRCVYRDTSEPATQECDIVQPGSGNPDASNRAFVLELIDQNTGPGQDGTQRSKIVQTATGGAQNFAHVIQYIKQSTNASGTQSQEGHQLSCAVQASEAGNEFAQTIQSLAQKEQSKDVAPVQNQNVAPRTDTCDFASGNNSFATSDANTFARVEQHASESGALESHVNQSHNLDARATNAGGFQTQGSSALTGGIQGKVFQDSAGVAKSFGVQNEDQNQTGNGPTVTQKQFGPLTCCATQTGNANDNVQIDQMSSQRAVTSPAPTNDLVPAAPNPFADQETLLIGTFETSGDGDITHKAKQNGGSAMSSCPPPETSEGPNTCALITFGQNGVFISECPEGTFFDSETGRCEPSD
jgi:hypothetical protein